MNKQNKSFFEKKGNSPLAERLNSPVSRVNTSGFIKSEQYYLEKLKSQREKIEMLINEFGKIADALEQRDLEITRLKELKDKHEEQKITQQKTQLQTKKELQILRDDNEKLKEEIHKLQSDGEKENLKAQINCLQEKANFFEGWYETLSSTNQQLKQERDQLTKQLENRRQDHESQIQELKEKTNSMLSELQETSKISGAELSYMKDIIADKQTEITKLNEDIRQNNAQTRSQQIKQENQIKQLAHTLQLREKQHQFKLESLQQDIKETRETLERRDQQLQKSKAECSEKRAELERTTERLEEMELKARVVYSDMEQLKQQMASSEELELLKMQVAELQEKCKDYEDYLQILRDQSLEQDKVRREFEMKRNQEVERIEKIFTRIRTRGIDLPSFTE